MGRMYVQGVDSDITLSHPLQTSTFKEIMWKKKFSFIGWKCIFKRGDIAACLFRNMFILGLTSMS